MMRRIRFGTIPSKMKTASIQMEYKTFETERLIIRPTSEHDSELIFKLLNAPKCIKYIGDRNIKTVENAKEYIREKMIPQLERLGYSN